MGAREFLFTSESVTEGHPDKIADQISDTVLDAVLSDDADARCACETLITTRLVVVAGEISTETYVDIPKLVREKIAEIGYTHSEWGFDATTCGVVVEIEDQSPDIAQGVDASYEVQHDPGDNDPLDQVGAGDQGMMFGYATNETKELMPLPIMLAHKICRRLAEVRKAGELPYLRPDGKAQVTVRYETDEDGHQRPVEIKRVLVSTQHSDGISSEDLIKPDIIERVPRATSRRTSSRPAWRIVARSTWPTRSESRIPFRLPCRPSTPSTSPSIGSRVSSVSISTCGPQRSSATSTYDGRSSRRRPRTVISAERIVTSPGSARTRPMRFDRPPAWRPQLASSARTAGSERARPVVCRSTVRVERQCRAATAEVADRKLAGRGAPARRARSSAS